MARFTLANFEAEISQMPATNKRRRDSKPAVKVYNSDNLHLAIAPPSPRLGAEDENSETPTPFPDMDPPAKAEPGHCIMHCTDDVCRRMTKKQGKIPPCSCGDEIEEDMYPSEPEPKPKVQFESQTVRIIVDIESRYGSDRAIKFQRADIDPVLAPIRELMIQVAIADEDFLSALNGCLLFGRPMSKELTARRATQKFFSLVYEYFERTLRIDGVRTMTVAEFRTQFNLYIKTGMAEWIENHCDQETNEAVFDCLDDPRAILEYANFGAPAAVAKRWHIYLDYVVGVLMWRDQVVRKYEASQIVALMKVGVHMIAVCVHFMAIGFLLKKAGFSYMKDVWRKVSKHFWA
ncbi:hypothetical protein GQ44DRAFT_709595 [Phaeosphaeriaceae sp. PMI808]|nr:hypothetical protein GQ44DRAFT_709595 [Phaeosphaeriaceae sp. PMI808]